MTNDTTLTLTDSGVAYTVWFDRHDGDRCQYGYSIAEVGGNVLASGDDLRSGSGAEVDLADTLRSLVSFLGAFLESGETGENSDLFPAACRAIDSSAVESALMWIEVRS
jgi:hypothetical protein